MKKLGGKNHAMPCMVCGRANKIRTCTVMILSHLSPAHWTTARYQLIFIHPTCGNK